MFELFVAVLLGVFAVLATFFLRTKRAERGKLIPGWNNHAADKEMGDLRKAISCGSLHHYLLQQHRGGRCPVTSFWWGDQHVVSVCSPEAFKATENMYDKPKQLFAQFTEPLHGCNSIQSVNGTEWKERKKLHANIKGRKLESFFSDFVQIAQETEMMWSPGKPIRLMREMFRMLLKGILTTSLGNIFEDNSGIEELANTYHLCKCEMDRRILDVPPSPNSQRELEFQQNLKHLQDCLRQMIQARKDQKDRKALPLLDALLESAASEDQLLADMTTYLGGFHTAGYYALWTFYYLAQHLDVQEKLFGEVKDRVGGECGEKLKAYTLTSNSFLRQILDESLRISITASFDGHCSEQDTIVGGYHVPANTPIIQAIGVTMNDEAIWENPDCFNPDRFSPGSKHAKRGVEFRPFGISHTRRCPAKQFIYFMVSVYITILVQRFVFLTVDEQEPEKNYGIATSPRDEIHIQVKLRCQE